MKIGCRNNHNHGTTRNHTEVPRRFVLFRGKFPFCASRTSAFAALLAAAISSPAAEAADWTRAEWTLPAEVARDGDILVVDLPQTGTAMATTPVDLSPFAGKCVTARIRVAARDLLPVPRRRHLGYKFMLSFRDTASGEMMWLGAPCLAGTFDWCKSTIEIDLRGRDPGPATLHLGIQDSSGCVRFDLSSLEIAEVAPLFPDDVSTTPCRYSPRIAARPVGRGVMLPSEPCKEEDFRTLREWGATLARYQMIRGWGKVGDNADIAEFSAWVDSKIDHLLRDVLPWAEKYGIDIVVDLHVTPGGVDESRDTAMLHDPRFADAFVEIWRSIARRCKGQPRIWGYDLVNEPVQTLPAAPGCDYLALQARAAKAVREIDPDTPIVVESNMACAPRTFSYLAPLDLEDVIYQVHMYVPTEFTHQGVYGGQPIAYPNAGRGWDREALRKALAPVSDFQLRHGARIYVGEFSAICWAEGADRYLADCIALFEEYGWDWTYHAFREWAGWSVEHEGTCHADLHPSSDNPRKRALLDGLSRNAGEHD